MSETKTPRTDEIIKDHWFRFHHAEDKRHYIPVEFARQLETELADVLKIAQEIRDSVEHEGKDWPKENDPERTRIVVGINRPRFLSAVEALSKIEQKTYE